jgi:hypothetical protein
MAKDVLPKVARDPILNKSVWVAIFITILAFLDASLIALTSLTGQGVSSVGFFTTLFVVFIVAEIVDVLAGSNYKRYVLQNLLGAILVALLMASVLGLVGITSLSSINLLSGLGVLVGSGILFYIGAWIEKKFL